MSPRFTRPDFSDFVVHFTKDKPPISAEHGGATSVPGVVAMTASDRLSAILRDRVIRASNMPWTNALAVCFTECVWSSLLAHADAYSSYGVGFHKSKLFQADGGPAFYVRRELYDAQLRHRSKDVNGIAGWHPDVWPFITPFNPKYARTQGRRYVDYSHEREWRVPADFHFDLTDVAFIVVDRYEDEAQMPRDIKNAVGRENVLIMDNYRRVRELWPTEGQAP